MNRKLKTVLVAAACLAMCGCSIMLPKTTIKGTLAGKPFKFVCPQNLNLQGLEITAKQVGTNEVDVSIKLQSSNAVTDPNVVAATAAGQAQLLGATANLVQQSATALQQVGQMAATAYATGGASLVVPKATPAAK